jgi:hypothetical protein
MTVPFAPRVISSWPRGLGWANSNLFGFTGDWVIRATVDSGGGTPDARVPDAAVPQPDANVPGPDAGGNQCQVNSECPTGQYCVGNDTCTYDCRVDCDNGMGCTSLGKCERANQGGGCSRGRRTSGEGGGGRFRR